MSVYRFIKDRDSANRFDISTIEMTVDTPSLPDVIEEFENFLRAAGFVFDGRLQLVEEDEPSEAYDAARENF